MWVAYMCFGVGIYNIWKGIKDFLGLRKLRKNGKKIAARVSSVGEGKDGFFYKLTYQDEAGSHELRYDLPRSAKMKNLLPTGAQASLFADPKNSSRLIPLRSAPSFRPRGKNTIRTVCSPAATSNASSPCPAAKVSTGFPSTSTVQPAS